MKKKPASRSAFFNPRVLIGFVLCSIGLLLALIGLSKSVANSLGNPVLKTGMVPHESTPTPCQFQVLIVYDDSYRPTQFQSEILAEPNVTAVDLVDGHFGTPTLAQLQRYDIVVPCGALGFQDSDTLGNNLADYVDGGGIVVQYGITHWGPGSGVGINGRWVSGGYNAYDYSFNFEFNSFSLGAFNAEHPLMAGVTALNSNLANVVTPNAAATEVAQNNFGESLVAFRPVSGGHTTVGVTAYVGSTAIQNHSGDWARVVVNAGNWLLSCGPSGACLPPPTGVVSWWAGDGNPEDLYDLNDLTAQNGATFGPGKVSQALSLDGVDDYFTVANNGSLNPGTSDFTFEFWVHTTQTTDGYILDKRSGCGLSSFYNIQLKDSGIAVELCQDTTVTNYNVVISPVPINDGGWHHVAVVRQGVTASIYIDGVLSASASTPGITNISNQRPLTIGTGSCLRQFGGMVDELTYYESALPASTIAAIYSAGSLGKCKASSFVQSIDPTWAPIGNLKNVTNTTTAVDANGFPVNYATVVIKVTDPTGAVTGYTSTTNESGQATFSFLTSQSGTFKFAIKRIFKTAITYDASMNIQSRARLILP